jgi:hypothetical protein
MEKVVNSQLTKYLNDNDCLCQAQHGFITGRSTLTNLLQCDKYISECLIACNPFDIISFDFCKAFDKVPHQCVLNAASELDSALAWIASFLTERTQRVKVNNCLSNRRDVISGTMQGSVLGPTLYIIAINPLLRSIELPVGAFADDIKLVANVRIHTKSEVQSVINKIADWAKLHHMPISFEKTAVMHCGSNQPKNVYELNDQPIIVVENYKDLGVYMSSDSKFSVQYEKVVSKAAKAAYAIRRIFKSRQQRLMWPAFQAYILPIITYCSPVWNPNLQRDIDLVKRVQRSFTKAIRGFKDKSYSDRLHTLSALSLHQRRTLSDMVTVHKIVYNKMLCTPANLGLSLVTSNTRANGVRLTQQRATSKVCAAHFMCRAPSQWNKLPAHIINNKSLPCFKKLLKKKFKTAYNMILIQDC